jgi:putative transposase
MSSSRPTGYIRVLLAWRKSGGARRSLGWIPFKVRIIRYRAGQIYFAGRWLSVGSILDRSVPSVGIDLGLSTFAAFSDEALPPIEAERFYRDLEPVLARAQRARHRQRSRAIHAKIANRRKDFLHKLSTRLVKANGAVFVGNVNACALAKTRHAKSVLDAGWSAFRTMLQYKCADAGVCNSRAGPKGRKDLGIGGWQCTVCRAVHDRNVNAAHNILAAGHRRLAEGISVL